tara:strand:- start:277 stop:519 length:243 start_codon:yes stop_codon:yes gene_type:complete
MSDKRKHPNPLLNFIFNYIEDIAVILMKGFVGCLVIGFPLELMGIDLLLGTTIHTHFYEYVGSMLFVGTILHYILWKTGE